MSPPDRAPDNPVVKPSRAFSLRSWFWDYTLEEWAEIKNVLAYVGINNADTVTLTTFESDPRHAELLAAQPGLHDARLRETLVYTARAAAALHGITPTPKQNADKLRNALAKVEAAQRALDGFPWPAAYWLRRAAASLKFDLDVLEAAPPDASRDHGVSAAGVFQAHVVAIWDELTAGLPNRPLRKLLVNFLLACTSPAFPTTPPAVERWLRRYQPKHPA